MAKRKRQAAGAQGLTALETPESLPAETSSEPTLSRSARRGKLKEVTEIALAAVKDEINVHVVQNGQVVRASRAAKKQELGVAVNRRALGANDDERGDENAGDKVKEESSSPLSDLSTAPSPGRVTTTKTASARRPKKENNAEAHPSTKVSALTADIKKEDEVGQELVDPEAEDEETATPAEEIEAALTRPPPVNSDYLPLPWKGRLGYACLCTYLRYSNPPVFCSRTTRIASIMERRHPLQDPDMPHHPIKNRPDRDQTPDVARGQAYVEQLGLANARDIVKMLRWNEKFGIRFLRLSSEMFPFASHEVYGYKLAPFASEVLAEAGNVAAELGHRLTTHPGQFTQLGSPRKEVIENAIRDLEYHSEMLSLLKLPPQLNRDAVMILHMGGVYGDKEATLDRFRENYGRLSQDIKNRLVLENDDVSWSVHDLLPICKELNIPLVLDFHHHNIIHSDEVREGTLDIMSLYEQIKKTWTRKGITQKMHYSEPEPKAVTARQRRKHSPRVATLPPCDPNMDLMIEAKDKEQAVFELMRTFKLPGWDRFNNIIPHIRVDENKSVKPTKKATPKKRLAKEKPDADGAPVGDAEHAVDQSIAPSLIPEEEVGMGGPDGRVYWPPGMEEWLRPAKRIVKKKDGDTPNTKEVKTKKRKVAMEEIEETTVVTAQAKKNKVMVQKTAISKRKNLKATATGTPSEDDSSDGLPNLSGPPSPILSATRAVPVRQSARAKKVNYAEAD